MNSANTPTLVGNKQNLMSHHSGISSIINQENNSGPNLNEIHIGSGKIGSNTATDHPNV